MTPLYGLVLAGGRSSRMRADKAALAYGGRPQLAAAFELLASRVAKAWVSVRPEQRTERVRAAHPQIVDEPGVEGPIAGILAAQAAQPDAAWLVVACDLPLLDATTLDELLAARDAHRLATAFISSFDGLPEPLCAIYEPASREPIRRYVAAGGSCPRKFLIGHDVALLTPANARALDNANTPEELAAARVALAARRTG
ncbi:MAG TPA: NTP transferase domain-containing protein [Steroidobacteraceae bacterium]|nr:NTP transferase domain-containing protein [Steroidobacteraceae bacterium]